MLARAVPEIPPGQWYEPKWDGFRTLVFIDGDDVHLDSRNGKEITRYFPEVVAAVRAELPSQCVLDGEIVMIGADGTLDFPSLQLRLHPAASRIALLARDTPAVLVVFDVLSMATHDLVDRPFAERRAILESITAGCRQVRLTPATTDRDRALRWFVQLEGAGLDGVIAKAPELPYVPGRRVMSKIKHRRTADCVVAGYRPHKSGPDAVGSLLLGLYGDPAAYGWDRGPVTESPSVQPPGAPALATPDGSRADSAAPQLFPVGVVGALTMARRRELAVELADLIIDPSEHPWPWAGQAGADLTGGGSRWNPGKSLGFVPLAPTRVLQVRYDAMQGNRFRHMAQFDRWRPDREPLSCTFDQLERPVAWRVDDLWTG